MDELKFVHYGVLVFLADRVWRCYGSPYVTRLEEVAADLAWPHGIEYLRQTLVELDAENWIKAERKVGSKTWTITLQGAAIDPSDEPTDADAGPGPSSDPGQPPTDLQLTSNYPQESELEVASNSPCPSTALVPLAEADRGPFQPPTDDRPKKRTKREEQTHSPPGSPPRSRARADIIDDCPVCDRRTRHLHQGDGRVVCVECGVLESEVLL